MCLTKDSALTAVLAGPRWGLLHVLGKERKKEGEKQEEKKAEKTENKEERDEKPWESAPHREARRAPGLPLTKDALKCSLAADLAVVLSAEAFEQLYAYAKAMETESEISCLGSVTRKGDVFRIERFYLVKQKGSFGSTEMDQEAIAELIERLAKEGKQEEARSIECWCHTHGSMSAFWSQTDEKTCRLLVSDVLISIVVGGGFEVRCRLDIRMPISLTIDGIEVYYEPSIAEEDPDRYAKELKQYVIPDPADLCACWRADQTEKG